MYLKLDVVAGAKEESVERTSPDSFSVAVRGKAERNMANRRVLELMRREFGGQVIAKIISGHHSPRKIVSIERVSTPIP